MGVCESPRANHISYPKWAGRVDPNPILSVSTNQACLREVRQSSQDCLLMPLLTRSRARGKGATPRKSTGEAAKNSPQSPGRKVSRSPRRPSSPSPKSPRTSDRTQSASSDKKTMISSPDSRAARWFKSQPDLGPLPKCKLSHPSTLNHRICLASNAFAAKAKSQARKLCQGSSRKTHLSSSSDVAVDLTSPSSRKVVSLRSMSVSEEEEEEEEEGLDEEEGLEEEDEDYEEEDDKGEDEGDHPMKKKRTKSGSRRKPRGISEHNQKNIRGIMKESNDSAFIVSVAHFQPGRRRPRVAWTPKEVLYPPRKIVLINLQFIRYLRMGVEKFGYAWADILACPDYSFHPARKHVDLKDKWRNVANYRPYGSHGKRTFILLDEFHQPLLRPDIGKPYKFNNRWPRDAAMKAASRDEFYLNGATVTTIYVREMRNVATAAVAAAMSEDEADEEESLDQLPPIVHVYKGSRRLAIAPSHLAQFDVESVWVSKVRKVREERYITRQAL